MTFHPHHDSFPGLTIFSEDKHQAWKWMAMPVLGTALIMANPPLDLVCATLVALLQN